MEQPRELHHQLLDLERQLLNGRITSTLLVALLSASPAGAVYRQGPLEVGARLGVQTTFQHHDARSIEWVQERNELRLDVRYDLLGGRDLLGLRQASFNLLYRGRYDSVFDIRERYDERGYRRDDFRFPEGKVPRELFFDLRFSGALSQLSARIGRQQVVWGEADLFRSLDVINPLRLDQNGIFGERFADFREPLWIAKFLYNVGQAGPLADVGIEALYSPNGRPLTDRLIFGEEFRIKFDNPLRGPNRRPADVPFDRIRHPWELTRDGPYLTETFDQAVLPAPLGNVDLIYLNRNDIPTKTLSFDASVVGLRVLGKTFGGLDFTLNYIYKRSDLPGTAIQFHDLFDPALSTTGGPNPRLDKLAEAVAAEATPDLNGNGIADGREALIERCLVREEPVYIIGSLRGRSQNLATACLTKPFHYPWTHIIGGTLTYSDTDRTGLVFRLEQSYSTKEPANGMRPAAGSRAGEFPTARDFDTKLLREKSVWRSMVGFDTLRAFPWMPLTRHDPWILTFQFRNEYYNHVNGHVGPTFSITDRPQHWNPLLTFMATGYFVNSRFRPTFAAAYDVAVSFPVFWMQGEVYLADRWTLRLGDVIYAGSKHAESFVLLNHYADRDTLFFQISYLLL